MNIPKSTVVEYKLALHEMDFNTLSGSEALALMSTLQKYSSSNYGSEMTSKLIDQFYKPSESQESMDYSDDESIDIPPVKVRKVGDDDQSESSEGSLECET